MLRKETQNKIAKNVDKNKFSIVYAYENDSWQVVKFTCKRCSVDLKTENAINNHDKSCDYYYTSKNKRLERK